MSGETQPSLLLAYRNGGGDGTTDFLTPLLILSLIYASISFLWDITFIFTGEVFPIQFDERFGLLLCRTWIRYSIAYAPFVDGCFALAAILGLLRLRIASSVIVISASILVIVACFGQIAFGVEGHFTSGDRTIWGQHFWGAWALIVSRAAFALPTVTLPVALVLCASSKRRRDPLPLDHMLVMAVGVIAVTCLGWKSIEVLSGKWPNTFDWVARAPNALTIVDRAFTVVGSLSWRIFTIGLVIGGLILVFSRGRIRKAMIVPAFALVVLAIVLCGEENLFVLCRWMSRSVMPATRFSDPPSTNDLIYTIFQNLSEKVEFVLFPMTCIVILRRAKRLSSDVAAR